MSRLPYLEIHIESRSSVAVSRHRIPTDNQKLQWWLLLSKAYEIRQFHRRNILPIHS